jgi:ketosteroid isomerase-like protein
MSQENVDLINALLPDPATDVAALFRDDDAYSRWRETVRPFFTDDYQSIIVTPAEVQAHSGLEGARRFWLDWFEPWATYRSTVDDVIDAGERVVVLLRDRGRRRDMDAEVELIGAAIWTIKDGKVARIEHHSDRARALQAAGLPEDIHTAN